VSENPLAFPNTGNSAWNLQPDPGMTLRDWFAGQALVGLLSSGKWHNDGTGFEEFIATHAANIADAMLAERSKP